MSQSNTNNSNSTRFSELLTGAIILAVVGVALFSIRPILSAVESGFEDFSDTGAAGVTDAAGEVTAVATSLLPTVPTDDDATQALIEENIDSINKQGSNEASRDISYRLERERERLKDEVTAVIFKQALHFFLNTIAYESAVWLASGGEGQSPQFHTKSWGDYLLDVGDQALGLFFEEMSEDFLGGLDICEPSLNIKLNIGLGLLRPQRAKGPNCSLSEIANNWSEFVTSGTFLENFSASFDPWNNDIGIAIESSAKYDLFVKYQLDAETKNREESQGVIPKLSNIGNQILTPGVAIVGLIDSNTDNYGKGEQVFTGEIVADAINTFTTTLAGKLFQRLFQEGLALLAGSDSGSSGTGSFFSSRDRGQDDLYDPGNSGSTVSGRQAASERFTDFYYAGIRQSGGPFKLTEELSVCGDINNPGPTECVIDHSFRLAIEQQLTVREALERNLLDGNAPFGYLSFNQQPRYNEGYPYRSLLILRSHRIIPVTWELTAEIINKMLSGEVGDYAIQGAVTLNDLVDAFEDESSPFYQLIDPDWVLKAEEVFCSEEGYGPQLTSDYVLDGQRNVSRELYCANFESCIQKDIEGNCIFGHCTEERRVWNLNAESCPDRYATCQIFSGRDGNANAYLANSLEYNGCNIDNVGCQWYCRDYNVISDSWTCTNPTERVLKSCEVASGCPLAVNCEVDPGEVLCVDDVTGATLTLSRPCSQGSQWWNSTLNRCVVGTSCTVPLQGVSCEITGCEDEENLVRNPGFEGGSQPTSEFNKRYVADGWFTDNNGAPYFQQVGGSQDRVFAGQRSIRFYNSGGPAASDLGVSLRSDPIAVQAGNYTFSSNIFNNLNLGQVEVSIISLDSDAVVTQNIRPLRLDSSISRGEWFNLGTDFNVNTGNLSGTRNIQIVVNFRGNEVVAQNNQVSGTVWLDEFFISGSCFVDPVTMALSGTIEADQSKIHFDRDVLTCDEDDAGCSSFVRLAPNLGTNVLINSSFELWSNLQSSPDAWFGVGGPGGSGYGTDPRYNDATRFYRNTDDPVVGSQAMGYSHNHAQTFLPFVRPGEGYYLSFWARADRNQENAIAATLLWQERHSDGATDPLGTAWARYENLNYRNDRPEIDLTTQWQRFVLDPVLIPLNVEPGTLRLSLSHQQTWWSNDPNPSVIVYVDGVQFEPVDFNGEYSEYSDYASKNVVHLRQAPTYLGCQGYTLERPSPYVLDGVTQSACRGETLVWQPDSCNGVYCCHEIDASECYDYALYCQQDEVGCEGYRPAVGGPVIPGVVSYTDYCPVECVGYDAYRQAATYFETQQEVSYFIPSTADECIAAAAGCDEFTNLDEVARGGEATQYYTYIRHCSKPSEANCQNFYAWQGSDETGFQLQSYSLEADGSVPRLAITDTDSWLDAWGEPSSCDGPEDLLTNPFCRELFGNNGQIYYRILDNTISCSNDCHPLRKTSLGESEEIARANCAASNPAYVDGAPDSANRGWEDGACIYHAIPSEGQRCSAQFVGCREYRGNQSGNVYVAYENTFESGTSRGWVHGQISSVSLQVGGHSLQSVDRSVLDVWPGNVNSVGTFFGNVAVWNQQVGSSGYDSGFTTCDPDVIPRCEDSNGLLPCYDQVKNVCVASTPASPSQTCDVAVGDSGCGTLSGLLKPNKTYTVSFWAKTQSRERSSISLGIAGHTSQNILSQNAFDLVSLRDVNFGDALTSVEITREWQYYKFGPFGFDTIEPTVVFGIDSPTDIPNNGFYIDNIRFEEVNDHEYLIKNSWNTPLSCDTNPYTDPPINSPQYMLGCQEYLDTSNRSHTLKSFSRLCREDAIGCEALIDTHNSDSPFEQQFNATDVISNVTVPADSVVYLTNRSEFSCSAFSQGCELVGQPTLTADGIVASYDDIALINDPDQYGSSLCINEEVGCEEYQSSLGFSYFKDPGQKRCEYRSAVGGRRAGWYKINSIATRPDCPIEASPTGVFHPADNWVGMCPDIYNGCTEYIDPVSDISNNLLFNSDFKQDNDNDTRPDGWLGSYGGNYDSDPETEYAAIYQRVPLKRNTTYTLGITVNEDAPQDVRRRILNNFRIRMAEVSGLTSIDNTVRVSKSGAEAYVCRNTYTSNPTNPSAWKTCSVQGLGTPGNTCTPAEGPCVNADELDVDIKICRDEFQASFTDSSDWQLCRVDSDCGAGDICISGNEVCIEDRNVLCSLDSHCLGAGNICTALFFELEPSVYRGDARNLPGEVTYTGRFHTPDYAVSNNARVEISYLDPSTITGSVTGPDLFGDIPDIQSAIKHVSLRETGVYYGINSTVDTVSCNGIVDPAEGCVLFNDRSGVNHSIGETDTSYLIFDASASSPEFNNGLPSTECLGACDSNKVVSVRPDRVCGQWLECATEYHNVGEGGIDQSYCLDLAVCDQLDEEGNCTNFVSDFRLQPQEGLENQTAVDPEQLRNVSGYTKAGLLLQDELGQSLAREGFRHFGNMDQVGEITTIQNGGFEFFYSTGKPVGWQYADSLVQWQSSFFSTIANTSFSEAIEGINIREGAGMLRLSAGTDFFRNPYAVISEPFEVLPNTNYNFTIDTNTLNLKPDAAEAYAYLEGRVAGTANAYQPLLGSVTRVAAGLDWRSRLVTFNTANFNSLRVRLTHILPADRNNPQFEECIDGNGDGRCDLEGASFFDNIKIVPALVVQDLDRDNNGGFESQNLVAPSCRVYPTEEALACQYVDTQNILNVGRQGYCLQYDPNNPEVCLQWYPVDLIKGDFVDEFRGYTNRAPLYYCAKMSNTTIPIYVGNTGSDFKYPGGPRPWTGTWQFTPSAAYGKPSYITIVDVQSQGGSSFNFDTLSLTPGNDYAIGWIGENADPNNINYNDYSGRGCAPGQTSLNVNGKSYPCEDNRPFHAGGRATKLPDRLIEQAQRGGFGKAGEIWTGARRAEESVKDHNYCFRDYNRGIDNTKSCRKPDSSCGGDDWERKKTIIWVDADFGDDSNLEVINYGVCDHSSDVGGFRFAFQFHYQFCEEIVEIVTPAGQNKAWFSRITPGSDYAVPTLDYLYSQDSSPYGAVVNPAPVDDPSSWDAKDDAADNPANPSDDQLFIGNQPLFIEAPDTENFNPPYQARAGSPYSCSNPNGDKPCFLPDRTFIEINNSDPNGSAPAADRLKRLFAQSYSVWTWDSVNTGIISGQARICGPFTDSPNNICTIDADCFNSASEVIAGSCAQKSPQYVRTDKPNLLWSTPTAQCQNNRRPLPSGTDDFNAAVQACNDGNAALCDYCGVAPVVRNILINNVADRPIESINLRGASDISLTFNGSVDGSQLPLSRIRVDWGDGFISTFAGQQLRDRPNSENPYVFSHAYSYYDLLEKDLEEPSGAANRIYCPGNIGLEKPAWASALTLGDRRCAVKPRIKLVDNWGWCNAELNALGQPATPGTWGYVGTACETEDAAWTSFNHYIMVGVD